MMVPRLRTAGTAGQKKPATLTAIKALLRGSRQAWTGVASPSERRKPWL
jgi:hypothetical protein